VSHLSSKVQDFITDFQWSIPTTVRAKFPQLGPILDKICIPKVPLEDRFVWKHSNTGCLTLKDAFCHKSSIGQNMHWAGIIWSIDIPPSKSLMAWRLMHDKLPTDDKMMERGSNMASMCSNCNSQPESSAHLFLQCSFASKVWNWFSSILNFPLNFNAISDIWKISERRWTPQCKIVIIACLINILNTIWFVRNQTRFQDKTITWKVAINMIISSTASSGNSTLKTSAVDMTEFSILKALKINIHPPRAPTIKEVIWHPPISRWLKVNTDGAVLEHVWKLS
jgi:hypothetical protein